MNAIKLPVIEQKKMLQDKSKVRIATFDIMDACPNKCIFCYNTLNNRAHRSISFARFKELVDSMPNLERVNIGGGEPLLHKELPQILSYCLEKGLTTDISTSGLVWRDDIAEIAKQYSTLFGMQVNVPAGSAETFGKMTGNSSNFAKLTENLGKFASLLGTDAVRVHITLCKENAPDTPLIAEIARKIGAPLYIQFYLPIPGSASNMVSKDELASVQFLAAALEASGQEVHFEEGWNGETMCPSLAYAYGFRLKKGGCPALKGERIYVDAGGNESACEFLI